MTLSIVDLNKWLGGRRVLDGVSLSAARGDVVALFGDNGAGKSTLLRILAGVLDADGGRATLDGASILGPRAAARAHVGYVPEAADAPAHLSPRELAALVAALKRVPLPDEALLERLGLRAYWDRPFGGLSLGQRRRSCLCAAILGDVRLLLLDEPTNGLDAAGVRELATLLEERRAAGTTILVATHDPAFAEAIGATRVRLSAGKLEA
ncbi:ABC transporter ATP-binding protein [Polyangium jinanense]|uniref:ABC transporter ATP-binding protein n=1 Tax=Polyangium jinanense TaxID=2829994 RepID=A0A9X3XJN9_9BACT|nr:ABC transporter ATP-binding protein [Polyangium jinanense]MDC3962893.1 ABC transporter ATP-binding protein [Polyangium jinanense]MDC3989411.1 ABC transporter ATP-binding protein [Polyangium jinanense]